MLLLLPQLLHLFFTSNSVVFVDGGRKIIPCSRAQGTLATPLILNYNFTYDYDNRHSLLKIYVLSVSIVYWISQK